MDAAERGQQTAEEMGRAEEMHRALNGRASIAAIGSSAWAALEDSGDAPIGVDEDDWRALQEMRACMEARRRWRLLRCTIAATAARSRRLRAQQRARQRWRRVRLAIVRLLPPDTPTRAAQLPQRGRAPDERAAAAERARISDCIAWRRGGRRALREPRLRQLTDGF